MSLLDCFRKSKTTTDLLPSIQILFNNCENTLNHLNRYLDYKEATNQEKKAFLEYTINVIGRDIQSHYLASCFYRDSLTYYEQGHLFPIYMFMKHSCTIPNLPTAGKTVISEPYDMDKLFGAVQDIRREGFQKKLNYTSGIYIPEMNMIFVVNGRHHMAAASILDKGFVDVNVYKLSDVFSTLKVSEDWKFWCHEEDRIPIADPRFALIYEIAREIASL